MPTLILHSVDDRMNDFELSRTLATHIPDARLVTVQSGGHLMLGDHREATREVARFIAAHSASRAEARA